MLKKQNWHDLALQTHLLPKVLRKRSVLLQNVAERSISCGVLLFMHAIFDQIFPPYSPKWCTSHEESENTNHLSFWILHQRSTTCNDNIVPYWIHNGFVTVGVENMSESLGNYVTLHFEGLWRMSLVFKSKLRKSYKTQRH